MATPSRAHLGCSDCGVERNADTAYPAGVRKDGTQRYTTRCRRCHNAQQRTRETFAEKQRDWKRARRREAGIVPLTERPPRTHCHRGHLYDTTHHGRPACKTCKRDAAAADRRAAGIPPYVRRTHWPKGHALVSGNLRQGRHAGRCLLCHRIRETRRYDRDAARYLEIILPDPCVYCGGPSGTVDHIVPVALGGSDDWTNLAPSCHSCNARKRTMPLLSFLLRKGAAA